MRPLCLTMTAFGPYAQQQKLDFKELQDRTFFLIHGPTGSGKTTILDGMCFAFFGDASGAQRDSKSMRSDHADGAMITEVIFDFAIGKACYRVKRIPEQERPKKRGDGTTTMLAQAELWSIPEAGEPVLLATKWLDVTKQIEILLGFKSSQFRQVVLLPQGEFRKLLTANSNERQEIMQALFKTDLYRTIEEKLKDNAQQLKKSSEDLTKQRQWILQEAGVEHENELLDNVKQNEKEVEHLVSQIKSVSEELQLAQQAVNQGLAVQEKIREKKKAEQLLAELTQQKPAIEQERVGLLRATEAASLFDAEKNVANYAQDTQALEESCKIYKNELEIANQNAREAQRLFETESANEGERERLAREIINLQQIEDKIKILQEAIEIVSASQNKLSQAVERKQQVELRCTRIQGKIDHVIIEQQKYMQLALEVGSRQVQWQSGQGLLTKRRQLEEYRQMFAQLGQQFLASELQLAGLEKDYEIAKRRFIELQHDWVQGQAALMANALIKGVGCPVCGSMEHPKPATSVGQVPDESQIKTAQGLLEAMEQKKEKFRNEHSSLQTEWNTWGKRVTDLLEELKEQADISLEEFDKDVYLLREQYEEALTGERQAKDLAEKLGKLTKEQEENHKELAQVEEAWRQADQLFKASETIVQERRLAIPEELQEKGKLAATLKNAQHKYEQSKIVWEYAQHNVQQKKQLVIKQQTLLENTQTRLMDHKEKYEEEQRYFLKRVAASGFIDQHDYQKAKKSQEVMDATAKKIAVFDSEFSKASLFLEHALQAAATLELPDMLYLQQVATDMQNRYKVVFAAHTNLEAQISRQQTSLKKIVQVHEKLKTLEAQYAVVGRLAEVANGGNEHKLTLQRFVLGTLLENVIVAANERLNMMSRNRYSLQRTLDRARKNAAGGLDLEVFDNYTGIARGVGTLSGGETFLASLSLALGLADVVQSYAGGIHLDTILVDEGFGTLDPESLDFAIKALIDLQQGGRLVGIISHVPELKERIDARLEVMATERGSKACFKIG
jgi:exonuclease SbcC